MTREEIISKADDIIREHLFGDDREINSADDFVDDLGADSLDLVEITMAVEDLFEVTITEDETENIKAVSDLHDLLIAKLKPEA